VITAILAAFDEYEVVAIPEGEGWQDQGGFILTLIRNPGFPDKVNGIEVEYSNSLYQPSWTVISPRTTCSGRAFVVFKPLAFRGANDYRNPDFIDGPENRTSTRPGQRHRRGRGLRFFFNSSALFALSGDTAAVWSGGNRARAAHAESA
jgi:hypothetical protein